jgi:hypothetical protein
VNNINQILQDYQTRFAGSWYSHFQLDATIISKSNKQSFIQFLDDAKKIFFLHLNQSILIGEYATEIDFEVNLAALETFVNTQIVSEPYPSLYGQKIIQNEFNKDFHENIKFLIKAYRALYDQLQYRIQKNLNKKLAIKNKLEVESHLEFIKRPTTKLNVKFAFLNIKISLHDISMRPTEDNIDFLHSAILDLQAGIFGAEPLQPVLLLKCKFLFSKIFLRGNVDEHEEQYYLEGGRLTIIDPRSYVDPIYNNWFQYTENHYEISNSWARAIKNEYNHFKSIPLDNLSFQQLHTKIKYYKDIAKDYNALGEICEYLRNKLSATNLSAEELYIFAVDYSYAINNQFSLLLEDKSRKIEEIRSFYKEILSIQDKKGISNFFADFKYFEYLIQQLDGLTVNRSMIKELSKARGLIDEAYKLLNDYDEHVKWCHENYNYVYLLPFNESIVQLQNPNLKLFLFSSFLLPLAKDRYESDFRQNKLKLDNYKTSLDCIDNISNDLNVLKDQQSEYNKRESRSMEIIGIFTAIVTFVAGTIQSFKFITTPMQAFLFMLAFGSALSFFLFLLIFFNRQENFKKIKNYLLGFIIIILLFWAFLAKFYSDGKSTLSEMKKPFPNRVSDTTTKKVSTYQKASMEIAKMVNEKSKDTSNVSD